MVRKRVGFSSLGLRKDDGTPGSRKEAGALDLKGED